MELRHGNQLALPTCPHCGVNRPSLHAAWHRESTDHAGGNERAWGAYCCASCGGVVLAVAPGLRQHQEFISMTWPQNDSTSDSVPSRAREFMEQARASLHAPAGALMLAASAVDAMLKDKGYRDGSLYGRIDQAAKDHLITNEMAAWAHEIRLDANDQRHADDEAPMPSQDDALKAVEFVKALAQFLFVLPARVERGRAAS